jgi:hypothetical protein
MRFLIVTLLTGAFLMTEPASAKRATPPELAPIQTETSICMFSRAPSVNGKRYTMHIECKTADGKKRLWRTKIFIKTLNPDLESDTQDIWLTEFARKDNHIVAVDEMGTRYTLDLATGKLLTPSSPIIYPRD